MRRFISLICLIPLTLAALWYFTPVLLPQLIASLLPDNIELRAIETQRPEHDNWTIQSLHVAYTPSTIQSTKPTQPSQWYNMLRRGPIDDLNTLLANYGINIEELIVEHSESSWKGSAQLGRGQLAFLLTGLLDSHTALISADIDLRQRLLSVEVSIGDQVQISASAKPSASTLNSSAESKLEFSINAAFTDVLIRANQPMQFGVAATSATEKTSITATSAELQLLGAFEYTNHAFSLSLDQQSHAVMQNLRHGDLTVPRFRAALRAPAKLTLRDGQLLLAPLRFTSNNLRVVHGNKELPRFRVTGDLSLHNNIASGSVHIASRIAALSDQITVSIPFSHSLDSGRGRGTLHSRPIVFNEQQRFLPSLVPNWHWPADLVGGELKLSGKLDWFDSDITAKLQADLHNIDAFYHGVLIRGINGMVKLQLTETSAITGLIEATAAQLQAGMTMTKLRLSAGFSASQVTVNSASFAMFNGLFRTSNISFDPGKPELSALVTLNNLELGELLKVEQGIEGSGIVDGQLPIFFSGSDVTMNNGTLKARPPGGVIRYTGTVPQAAIESSPQLQLAVDALKNFHYKVLDINTSYAENGKMMLRVRLQGRNPDMGNSRPINFNLNVTEDVPSLIKSLMLSREISDGLQQRIEQSQP